MLARLLHKNIVMPMFSQGFSQDISQVQRQSQSQVLRQICVQKMGMELRQEIAQKLSQNPLFECISDGRIEVYGDAPSSVDEGMDDRTVRAGDFDETDENGNTYNVDAEPDMVDAFKEFPAAEASIYDSADIDNYSIRNDATQCADKAQERRDFMFTNMEAHETLPEHLQGQISLAGFSKKDAEIAQKLVERIDEDGYLRMPIADLAMTCGVSEEKIRNVLDVIRTFDPVGCGSTSLREFLLLQGARFRRHRLAHKIRAVIANHLDDLANRRTAKVCSQLGLSADDLVEILSVIKTLDRSPAEGGEFSERPMLGNPDCHVRVGKDGQLVVTVDTRDTPEILVNENYLSMIEDPNTSAKTRAYLRQKMAEIDAWREALDNRGETIRKIVQKVVDVQGDYLQGKTAAIRPLTEKQIAEAVGVDPSTVSRCLKERVIARPSRQGGVVALRSLSTVGAVKTSAGELISNNAVKVRIRALIEGEDKAHPLSDQTLTDQLNKEGVAVARRTVRKYREALGYANSTARRQI